MKEIAWPQIYRPKTLDECVLPKSYRTIFEQILEDNEIPDLLLYSKAAGVGKTTIARILCETLNYDYIEINGSDENGIDVIRGRIQSHASTESLDGERKAVIIDEADGITLQAQNAFKGFIEKYSSNCTFIFTCNSVNKIQRPIRSRLAPIDFDFRAVDEKDLKVQMFERAQYILDSEKVDYDPMALAKIISNEYPQFRNILYLLQKLSKLGKIEKLQTLEDDYTEVLEYVKKKEWTKMRNWCAENYTLGMDNVANATIKRLEKSITPSSRPDFFQIVHQYMVDHNFAANTEICMVAMFSAIITTCMFNESG